MIKVFNSENEAVKCAEDIHNYLLLNRPGYNAEKWCDINKSELGDEWAVEMPLEFVTDKWAIVMDKSIADSAVKEIEDFPFGWRKDTLGLDKS